MMLQTIRQTWGFERLVVWCILWARFYQSCAVLLADATNSRQNGIAINLES